MSPTDSRMAAISSSACACSGNARYVASHAPMAARQLPCLLQQPGVLLPQLEVPGRQLAGASQVVGGPGDVPKRRPHPGLPPEPAGLRLLEPDGGLALQAGLDRPAELIQRRREGRPAAGVVLRRERDAEKRLRRRRADRGPAARARRPGDVGAVGRQARQPVGRRPVLTHPVVEPRLAERALQRRSRRCAANERARLAQCARGFPPRGEAEQGPGVAGVEGQRRLKGSRRGGRVSLGLGGFRDDRQKFGVGGGATLQDGLGEGLALAGLAAGQEALDEPGGELRRGGAHEAVQHVTAPAERVGEQLQVLGHAVVVKGAWGRELEPRVVVRVDLGALHEAPHVARVEQEPAQQLASRPGCRLAPDRQRLPGWPSAARAAPGPARTA